MNKKHLYATVILLLSLAVGIQPALATIILSESGWSDPTVGTWESTTKTATLTTDVTQTIQIDISGEINQDVILDGNGHTVDLGSSSSTGVSLAGRHYVTVQNIKVTGSIMQGSGIALNPSGYCNVINNTISGRQYGIFMSTAGTCIIEGNIISGNDIGINLIYGSVRNTINNNTIENNYVGLNITGIPAPPPEHPDYINKIYNNNFINNTPQAYITESAPNANVFDWDGIGNYWSDYEGEDPDGDGIGNTPYTFAGGQDNCPLMPTPQTKIVELIDTVEVMNLQQGINNSLDAKLDAAVSALEDVNQNNDVAAINSLNAFINAVEIQCANGRITNEQADTLIADANYIITLLSG